MEEHTPQSKTEVDEARGAAVVEMHARRETMADGRRYIIYYTFGGEDGSQENVNVRA